MEEEERPVAPRSGELTRLRIRSTALRMFTERGFEGTSIKDLADELGMTKSALYYHFVNKDAIVLSLFEDRQREIDELLAWVLAQPSGPGLLRETAMRWVAGLTEGAVQGMRFAHANRPSMRRLSGSHGTSPFAFNRIIDALVSDAASDAERLRVALVFEVGTSVVLAAEGLHVTDQEVLNAARTAMQRLTAPPSERTAVDASH